MFTMTSSDDIPLRTDEELRVAPVGLYIVCDEVHGARIPRLKSEPVRWCTRDGAIHSDATGWTLMARVRERGGHIPHAVERFEHRPDGKELIYQWTLGLWSLGAASPQRSAHAEA